MKPKDLALTIALGGAGGGGGGGDEDITKGTMAPNFSAETAYTAGDYVWHSGKLYRFTADHAAGSWDGTDAEEAPLSAGIGDLKSEINDLQTEVGTVDSYALASFPQETISNEAVATFTDGADNIPVKALTIDITPVQSGSGDPSPDNECPISGWDGVTVWRTGKNLLVLPAVYFTIDATIANCFFVKAGTYTLSYSCAETHRSGTRILDKSGNILSDSAHNPYASGFVYNSSAKAYYAGSNRTAGNKTDVLTIVEDCYIRIVSNQNAEGGGFTDAMLNIGSTAEPYVPYNGTSISISFGSTLYSGTLDVLTGVVTVDVGYTKLLSSWTWHYGTATGGFPFCYTTNITIPNELDKLRCNCLKTVTQNGPIGITRSGMGYLQAFVKDLGCESADDFKAFLNANDVYVAYPLATPLTIQLTPEQVSSLAGENVMWSNMNGDLTVTYRSS